MHNIVKKRIIMSIAAVMIVVFLVCTILGVIIFSFGMEAKPVKSDCIIILGCQVYGNEPSPFLKYRLEEGLRLYKLGYGRFIIVSGGKGAGEDIPEALAMRDYLISIGAPSSAVIMEDKSVSTFANITNSREKMDEYGLNSAVIVSNKYHLKRASLIAQKEGVEASYSGIFVSNYKGQELKGFLREILALMKYYITGK
jgi:uncharacterized SAM-binding protein YcdF (DUF218 family)